MKKIITTIVCAAATTLVFAQKMTDKINVPKGQKIQAEITIKAEVTPMPGMDVNTNVSSNAILEVKDISSKEITISNTLTKVKADMDMMGKNTTYDSDKPEDKNSDLGKLFQDKLNVPADVKLDNVTGKSLTENQVADSKEDAAMGGIMQMMGGATQDDIVSGAFIIIPAGKKAGDSWTDSSSDKSSKTVRSFTLVSVNGNEAVIKTKTTTDTNSDIELQGMSGTVVSTAVTNGDIIADIATALVKKKTMVTETSGNLQMMGQEMPINTKSTYTATYR